MIDSRPCYILQRRTLRLPVVFASLIRILISSFRQATCVNSLMRSPSTASRIPSRPSKTSKRSLKIGFASDHRKAFARMSPAERFLGSVIVLPKRPFVRRWRSISTRRSSIAGSSRAKMQNSEPPDAWHVGSMCRSPAACLVAASGRSSTESSGGNTWGSTSSCTHAQSAE